MKKLINRAEAVVGEALAGFEVAHLDMVRVSHDPRYIVRADAPVQGKVGILSGGGSGHEPLHGGFVGKGMLDAACPGEVFTSPTPDQIFEATRSINGGAGVLYIVKNYTGDVMNFEMAAELALAEGIQVESVVIDDDVSVTDSLYTAGRRGVGITVLAEKLCGAAAERGDRLQAVADLCRLVKTNGRSMGVALTSCTVPAAGKPTFDIGEDEIELGIGIHGEPGRERIPVQNADKVTAIMMDAILADLPLQQGDEVIVMLNGMGATPLIELYIVYRKLAQICQQNGIAIARRLIGNYITSLEMAGMSISVLKIDDELKKLWDAPVRTPALRWGI